MSLTGAEQAVVDHLAAEPGRVTRTGPRTPGGWAASTRAGGGWGADPATVRFRKTRAFPGCQLRDVGFVASDGRSYHLVLRTWQQPDGSWEVETIGGGSGCGPRRSRPWVNFAATWSAAQFAAGGDVTGQGAEAADRVRLTFADGTAVEDAVEDGVVLLFASPGVAFPARVEILGAAGDALAEYDEFTDFD